MDEQDLLRALIAGPVSGDTLARRFGLTRAAVWKRVQALRGAGIPVAAAAGRGYVLGSAIDLLDGAAIGAALVPKSADAITVLEVAWSLDSTNAELLRRAVPAQGVEVLLAERQTAGRGRRGRVWESPLAANLYLSLSRRFGGGLARLGGLSLAAGVATAEALRALGVAGRSLKWPNDLVVGGRKLGGVLVEGSGEAAGAARAVVGLGLNVAMPPGHGESITQPWTDLASLLPGTPATTLLPSRSMLAARLLNQLVPALELFERDGLEPFLARYAEHDALQGHPIMVFGGDGSRHHGIASGVATDGALRVRTDAGEQRFHSGEVSVRAG